MSRNQETRQRVASALGAAFGVKDYSPSPGYTREQSRNFVLKNADGFVLKRLTFNQSAEILRQNGIDGETDKIDEMLRQGVVLRDKSRLYDEEFQRTRRKVEYDDAD